VGTSPGLAATTTEVAVLPSRDCALGLRYLAAGIRMFLELRIDSARRGKSSSRSSGRKASGREWMASCDSLGARRKGGQGESPTGKDLLSRLETASKYGANAAAGVAESVTRRVTDPRSLTLVVTARGRTKFASLTRLAAMSGKVAAIRGACGCSEGEERGAKNLLSAVGRVLCAWVTGARLLADATLAAVRELLFFLPFEPPLEAAWAYQGWDLGQSGARWPERKVVGAGYLPSRKARASQDSGNLPA